MSIAPTRRALVVDDSRAAQIAAARLIEPYGFDVDLADDGLAGLRCMEDRGAYDLVLVDIRMPTMDGHELLRIMRARANFTPVVVMTAAADTRQLVSTLKLGSTDFLLKPLQAEPVRAALARALNLPAAVLKAESPRVLVVGPSEVAATISSALPPFVEVDRIEAEALGSSVERRPYRLVVFSLGAARATPAHEAEVATAEAAMASVLAVQPGAALCAVSREGEPIRGFDASVSIEDLHELLMASLYPNAIRPLVMHDDGLVLVMGFLGATGTEASYFAIAGRRLQLAVALHAAAGARPLVIDLSRVPAHSAAVERLAQEAIAGAAGRLPGLRLRVAPAMHGAVARLGLPAKIEVPAGRGLGPVFRWTPDLAVGVESIDRQHQELFSRVSALVTALRNGQGASVVGESLEFLEQYTLEHFADEEALMARASYPELAEHRGQHESFRTRLLELSKRHLREGPTSDVLREIELGVCPWLYRHVRQTDRAAGHFLAREP